MKYIYETYLACSAAEGSASNRAWNFSCHSSFSCSDKRPIQFATAVLRPPISSVFFPSLTISSATILLFSFAQKFPHVFPCLVFPFEPRIPVEVVRLLLNHVCILYLLCVSNCLLCSLLTYRMPQNRFLLCRKIKGWGQITPYLLLQNSSLFGTCARILRESRLQNSELCVAEVGLHGYCCWRVRRRRLWKR